MRKSTLLRIGKACVWTALVGWTAFGLWNGFRGTAELFELNRQGRSVSAQVTGLEPAQKGVPSGYIHYAFNDGSGSIDNKFVVASSQFSQFPIGTVIPVTYLPSDPHTVRIGSVSTGRVATTALTSTLFIVAGLVAFGLALVGLDGVIGGKIK